MDLEEWDFWKAMRAFTDARIGIDRCGAGIPTQALLSLQEAAALANDAVHRPHDFQKIARQLTNHECMIVTSRAVDRTTYLRRPDLGRQLDETSRSLLAERAGKQNFDLVFVVADGLSSSAVEHGAAEIILRCCDRLADWQIAPVIFASQARVALGDQIAAAINARSVAILIGERPGLSVSSSLGIYMTWRPWPGMPDSGRNCISNVHPRGLSPTEASEKLIWLLQEARQLNLSGVGLKENSAAALSALPFRGPSVAR